MKTKRYISIILCLLMTVTVVLSGCNNANEGPDDVPIKLVPAGDVISKYSKP